MAEKKDIKKLKESILDGDRKSLAKAITLIESNKTSHSKQAGELLNELLPHSGNSIRMGITGSPGAGKSTFIDTLGTILCEKRHKVCVLAVDPSSTISMGSILGDKTRMESLANYKDAFIRPSPSGGTLGGVAAKTRESIILCEAAGYDRIIIETIGVGQSETAVRSMVDLFMLVLLPGSGDELQGIKKGSVELSDMLIINKADGDNLNAANITQKSYKNALQLVKPVTKEWETPVLMCSAIDRTGFGDIINSINDFEKTIKNSGFFNDRRIRQKTKWFTARLEQELKRRFYSNRKVIDKITEMNKLIAKGQISPVEAVEIILKESGI